MTTTCTFGHFVMYFRSASPSPLALTYTVNHFPQGKIMDLQELASELNNFDTETFEVKDYIDYAEMAFGSTCSSSSCTSTCSSTSS